MLTDDDVKGYLCRSLHNELVSALRRQQARRRVLRERSAELGAFLHHSMQAEGITFEPDLAPCDVALILELLTSRVPDLLEGRRPERVAEVERLLRERLAMAAGELTFAALLDELGAQGMSSRVVGNRLRQRYLRAARDLKEGVRACPRVFLSHGVDPELVVRVVDELFSDRHR